MSVQRTFGGLKSVLGITSIPAISFLVIMLRIALLSIILVNALAFAPVGTRMGARSERSNLQMQGDGLKIDMRGKTVFVAGVADSTGYGWAIAKACAEAGAKIILGTWPPVLPIFQMGIERGQFEEDQKLSDGSMMEIAKIYPLDATFDDKESIPEEVAKGKRYKAFSGYSIQEVADAVEKDHGKIDFLVHSLANGPEGRLARVTIYD